ncbi:MAG: hypothetical protein PHU42_04250 [Patescibacteria group bacterium]|nr:hypothetical protein [Patescibacteria group bacterium]
MVNFERERIGGESKKETGSSEELMFAYERMDSIWDDLNKDKVFSYEIFRSLYSLIRKETSLLDRNQAIAFLNRLESELNHERSFLKPTDSEEMGHIADIKRIIEAEQAKLLQQEAA